MIYALPARPIIACCISALMLPPPAAHAQQVRVSGLRDTAYGTPSTLASDLTAAQSLCVYSSAKGGRYQVSASGSGSNGQFLMQSGRSTLAYEVQWASDTAQKTGTSLKPGVALTNLTSAAVDEKCGSGAPATASLIVTLRASALSAATAGSYSGTLTLLVAPN